MRRVRERCSYRQRVCPSRPLIIAVVLELFCGTARFARAMEEHRPVMRWDILFGEEYNLRSRAKQELVLGWLRAGWLAALWLGTPCQSFSRARNQPGGPPALRDKEHVHGLPDRRPCDAAAIELGNILARFSARVLLTAALLLVPAVIENPALSWIWQTRWLSSLARRHDFTFTVTEFCQWQNLPFRKATGFLHTCVELTIGERRCLGGRRGICTATGAPHRPLTGLTPEGKFWTKVAEPYPLRLCRRVAADIDGAIAARRCHLVKATVALTAPATGLL